MKKGLTGNALKLIAIAAMTLDHVAWWLFPGYPRAALPLAMHLIGRITCPIMCFFVAEGFHYTHDVQKYTRRLFLFALISHFAYQFGSMNFSGWRSFLPFGNGSLLNQTSVMWALAWGLVMLRIAESSRIRQGWARAALIFLACLAAFPSDWSCVASLCILAFGTNRGNLKAQTGWMLFYVAIYAAVYCLAIDPVYGLLQMGVVLAVPLLACYNGKRSTRPGTGGFMKWLFYIYYPLHLTLIGFAQYFT